LRRRRRRCCGIYTFFRKIFSPYNFLDDDDNDDDNDDDDDDDDDIHALNIHRGSSMQFFSLSTRDDDDEVENTLSLSFSLFLSIGIFETGPTRCSVLLADESPWRMSQQRRSRGSSTHRNDRRNAPGRAIRDGQTWARDREGGGGGGGGGERRKKFTRIVYRWPKKGTPKKRAGVPLKYFGRTWHESLLHRLKRKTKKL
jgi:hypothetical protein